MALASSSSLGHALIYGLHPPSKALCWRESVPCPLYKSRSDYIVKCLEEYRVDGQPGILLSAALEGRVGGLEDRYIHIPGEDIRQKMSVRIIWPGYAFKSKQVIIRDSSKNNNPILISKLARIIGFEVKCYIDVHRAIEGVDANWLLYPKGGIKFEHIILTKIIRVAKGSFQPIFDVVRYY